MESFPLLFDKLVYSFLLELFGNPLILALVIFIFIYIFGLVLRLSPEMMILTAYFTSVWVLSILIPEIKPILIVVLGIFVGLFIFYKILAR